MIGRRSRKSPLFKTISLFLVFTFLSYNVSFAVTEENVNPSDFTDSESVLTVNDIGVAIDSGTIKSRYSGDSGRTIVHIQDAHCNYEAQSNITKILEQLTKECGISIISVEGSEGIVDTAWFRAFPDSEIRKEVATYFMKKGEITGAEFFSIISDYKGTIFGAETRDYYVKNLKAFTEVYPYKDMMEKYFINTRTIANRLKSIVYPPGLKKLDSKIRTFDNKELELSDYAGYLYGSASKNGVNLKDCPNFKKLIQTLEYEEKIDFDVVDTERSEYIDALSKKMSKEEMTELVTQSIKFKKGHIKAVEFYFFLRELAKEHDIPMVQEYPDLFYYYIYTKLYDGIDNEGLFKEINTVEKRLKKKLFKNEVQEKLDKYSSVLNMYVDLVNIELTNEDYDLFKQYSKEFSLDDILAFLKKLCDKYNLNYAIDGVPAEIGDNIPNMVDFYEIAMKRDNALIDNTLKQMNKEGKERCVLIAGGFHTRGIKGILEKKGVSYAVVTPKITKDVETPYIKVLTNQRTSLEDIITESAVMPGMGIKTSSEEIVRPKGKLLAPLNKIFESIRLYLEKPESLKAIADAIGAVDERTVEDSAREIYKEIVSVLVRGWLIKTKEEADPAVWQMALEKWELVRGAYLKKCGDLAGKQEKRLNDKVKQSIVEEFEKIFKEEKRKSPGRGALRIDARNDLYEDLTDEQYPELDKVLAELIKKDRFKGKIEELPVMDIDYVDTRGIKVKGGLEICRLTGFREAIREHNRAIDRRTDLTSDQKEKIKIPEDVKVHPGTGRGKYKRMYIDARDWDALDGEQRQRLANHEYYHIMFPERTEEEACESVPVPVGKDTYLRDIRGIFDRIEKAEEVKVKKVQEKLIRTSKDMAEAADKGVGPDVVIIVSSPDLQTKFWQDTLTGSDNKHGSGVVVKKDAVVLSVSESNWKGGAGNGLGTLNGIIQAARKARDIGLLEDYGLPRSAKKASVEELIDALLAYCAGKSIFMYHTAGKGTRTSPLPGVEINSKPNIKLFNTNILESVLKQTSIYAPSRKGRISVFWGDQVIVNESDVDFEGRHHVEIFGQLVPLNKDIKAYGILIPGEEGDCMQREKLSEEEVRKLLPEGGDEAYKSIGSFTISLAFLKAMMSTKDHKEALEAEEGSLNTDPDWWQPLTSERDEYVNMMGKKAGDAWDKSKELQETVPKDEHIQAAETRAGTQWDRMQVLWNEFSDTENPAFKDSGMGRLLGFNDVGRNSFWWDYGQNKFYLRNMQLLTEDSLEGEAARVFFKIKEGEWIKDSKVNKKTVKIENSIIHGSKIKKGRLKNCVVIDCTLDEVYAENAVIIGSTVLKLNADGALCYNVVGRTANLKEGQILANVFHPKLGRIEMRTDVSRDGQADWKAGDGKGAYVFDNLFTYPEIAALMKKVTWKGVEKAKLDAIAKLQAIALVGPVEQAEQLSVKRNIDISEARQIVARRMLTFGDAGYFTAKSYSKTFNITETEAKAELEKLASLEQEKVDDKGKVIGLLDGIDKVETKIDGKAVMIYRKIPMTSRLEILKNFIALTFGTSGLRALVADMTDMECYINTMGFIAFLKERREIIEGGKIALGGDLRSSTPRIMAAVARAIEDSGYEVVFCGKVPTQTLAYYAMQNDMPSVMVTGSHIPEDRNGIKFTKKSGEVLKNDPVSGVMDEADILRNVAAARKAEYARTWKGSLFDENGMFKVKRALPAAEFEEKATYMYRRRYLDVFSGKPLAGKKIVLYQQSAVGRDIVQEIFEGLGAEVIPVGRSEKFIPVDTEKVSAETRALFKKWAEEYKPFAIISTDGDSDRPLFADENGDILPGDKLGMLAAIYLRAKSVAIPISANDGVVGMLSGKGVKVTQTKIGSPRVIKAMNDELSKNPEAKVTSWECNGGFLQGNDWIIKGRKLRSLPTRDAVLPMILAMLSAKQENEPISELIATKLPARYTQADVVKAEMPEEIKVDKETKEVLAKYTAEMGKEIIKMFSPAVMPGVIQFDLPGYKEADFPGYKADVDPHGPVKVHIDHPGKGTHVVKAAYGSEIEREARDISKKLRRYFTERRGFGDIVSVNFLDGIRIVFANGVVAHIRPSGNAPEFRFYATANTQERADDVVGKRIDIVKQMVVDMTARSPGIHTVRTKLSKVEMELERMVKRGSPLKIVPLFKTGEKGYTWGQPVPVSGILDLMGAKTEKERIALAEKYGISKEDVIGERWIGVGEIDIGAGTLSAGALALFGREVFGSEHLAQFGAITGITAKMLTSARPLSLQYHRFPEMIIPLGDGYAYVGLKRRVTEEEFIKCLREGDTSIFNRVELKKGQPMIIPPYMIHAYGVVGVYEIKAVTAAQDKAGTISFYDRLRLTDKEQAKVAGIVESNTPENAAAKLVEMKIVRKGKDVLTLPEARVLEIARELQKAGSFEKADIQAAMFTPHLESAPETRTEARYEKMGETKGFVAGRYTIEEGKAITAAGGTQGRQHALFVTEGKISIINARGKAVDELGPGEERLIPASLGEYTINALEGPAVIYTQYRPLPKTREVLKPVAMGDKVPGTDEHEWTEKIIYADFKNDMAPDTYVQLKIIGSRKVKDMKQAHTIIVQRGTVKIELPGEDIPPLEEGQSYRFKADHSEYKLINIGDQPAQVKIDYEKTKEERAFYAVLDMIMVHMAEIPFEKDIHLYLPSEIFVHGGINDVGSLAWIQNQLCIYVSKKITIRPYQSKTGLKSLTKMELQKDAVSVLIATKGNLQNSEEIESSDVTEFVGNVRVLAVPDKAVSFAEKGLSCNPELVGIALLATGITAESIKDRADTTSAAADLQRFLQQVLERPVERQDLYYIMPYRQLEAMRDEEIPFKGISEILRKGLAAWLDSLVNRILLDMPVKAFNATDQLYQRRKVMWSV